MTTSTHYDFTLCGNNIHHQCDGTAYCTQARDLVPCPCTCHKGGPQ